MTSAPATEQWRLLDVQAYDTQLARVEHRRSSLPESSALRDLTARGATIRDDLVAARTRAGDLARAVAKAEADVDQVRQRAARTGGRLAAGQGSAKDLEAMQHELGSLAKRQDDLEEVELEVMERQESAQAELDALVAEAERLDADTARTSAARDAAVAALDDERDAAARARTDAAAGVREELLALYERIRRSSDGVGAARLKARRCEGCHLELTPTDIAAIRAAPDDEVIRCEQCRRILVRTADSGL